MPSLTDKQKRFAEEYLVDLNATQAAIRAGYSARNADKIGPELLGKTRVSEAIQSAQQARANRVELTQDAIIHGLWAEAKLQGEGSSPSARVRAWELLGKHLGLFKDHVVHSGTVEQVVVYLPEKDQHAVDSEGQTAADPGEVSPQPG
jgi:phage terminase small subunit